MHALLALMRERGVRAVGVEVSAQALSGTASTDCVFDVVGFTNLSHDHLDDYADMERVLRGEAAAVPTPTARGAASSRSTPRRAGAWSTRRASPASRRHLRHRRGRMPRRRRLGRRDPRRARRPYTEFRLTGPDGRTLTTIVPVIGRHMAANAGLAIVMLARGRLRAGAHRRGARARRRHRRLPARPHRARLRRHAARGLRRLRPQPRRVREDARGGAHASRPASVIMVFGADGDRDATKRHDMGRDRVRGQRHPRHHRPPPALRGPRVDPRDAHRGRAPSAPDAEIHEVIAARARRSVAAVALVGEGDAILWAGPGHQDYRDIRGVRTPYSARRKPARRCAKRAGRGRDRTHARRDRGLDRRRAAPARRSAAADANVARHGARPTRARSTPAIDLLRPAAASRPTATCSSRPPSRHGAAWWSTERRLDAARCRRSSSPTRVDGAWPPSRTDVVAASARPRRPAVVGITGSNGKTTTKNMSRHPRARPARRSPRRVVQQ